MEDVQSAALTTDHWTSQAMDSYLGVTVHLITQDWEMKKCVLQVRQVKEQHDLQAVTTEQNDSKVSGVTTDNASNMMAALVLLPWPRMLCFALILQLAVKDGLKVQAVADILTRCKKIVGHFKHSLVARAALEVTQKILGLLKKKLVYYNTPHRDLILSSAEIAAIECAILWSTTLSTGNRNARRGEDALHHCNPAHFDSTEAKALANISCGATDGCLHETSYSKEHGQPLF